MSTESYRKSADASAGGTITSSTQEHLVRHYELFLNNLMREVESYHTSNDSTDGTIYTGLGGIAYMYWFVGRALNDSTYEALALYWSDVSLTKKCPTKALSFLLSNHGIYALNCIIKNNWDDSLLNIKIGKDDASEYLYGLAGLLYTLNLLKEFFPHKRDVIDQKINIIADRIIRQNEGSQSDPLWSFHGTLYYGAAHGVIGIVYQLPDRQLYDNFFARCDPNTNVKVHPLSTRSLCHWCHGIPGALCSNMYNQRWMNFVLEHGVLYHKGIGLCHGIAGNGYALLINHDVDNAIRFADIIIHSLDQLRNIPDNPFSLYEDLIAVLKGMKSTREVCFPAYGHTRFLT